MTTPSSSCIDQNDRNDACQSKTSNDKNGK